MAEQTFTPEFGPNGAVLNAPGVTPEFRRKLETEGSLKTAFREILLPIVFLLPLGFASVWVSQQNWVAMRDLCLAGAGFACGWWAYALMRRFNGWSRLHTNAGPKAAPPLIWRRAIDALDFGGTAILGGWLFWIIWSTTAADRSSLSGEPLFLFILASNLGLHTVRLASQRVRKAARKRGWATPDDF